MFLWAKPDESQIREFLDSARKMPLSYEEKGATQGTLPAGYTVDHSRIKLGDGSQTFERAATAVSTWKHFDLGWLRLVSDDVVPITNAVVAVVASHFPLYSLNACRVIYVIEDKDDPKRRFGFAYGTLSAHAERGEERFTVEWDTASDEVWYDILAFSRPGHWLVKIGYPVARWWQRRFARDSMQAMVRHARRPD